MKRIIISILFLLVSQLSKAQICTKSQLPLNLQNGLVGFYPFCGNANDGSGNGVNGVVNGATLTADRFGVANSAYRFNGTDNFITMANAPSNTFTSSFSISVWVKPSAGYGSGSSPNGNQNQVVSKWGFGGPNNAAYALGVDQTGAAFTGVHDGSNNSSAYSTPITVSINDWHHLVSTLSGGVLKLYINNVLVNTTFNSVNPQSSNYALEIAREAIGNYAYFKGDIDDIQLYNRALSHCEISQIYTSTTSTFTTPDILTYNSLPAQNSFCGSSLTLDAGAGFTNYLWNTGATSQTITATSSGEYRVTVTNASGCTASDTINVSLVKADILQSDQIACLNNPVTLSINSYATQSAKTIDFDNIGLAALDVSGGSAGTVAGVTGNGLSITRPTEVKTKDQTYGYGDYEVDAKTGDSFSNQYLSVLLPSNSWTNEGISIDSRPDGTDDVGWGVHVNAGLVASASGTHPASASNWYKMKIRVTPDSVKCWINNTLLYEGLNTSVPRNSGAVKLTSFSTSYFDNLKYTPYQTYSSVLWSTSATTSAISVTPTSTTTYFATISDGIASCTDSVKITINNIVGFNPLQDTVKVCGDSLVLDAGAGFTTYNWSNGASTRTITAKNSGKYVVTVTNANGCSASDTSYLSIVKAKIIQPDTTICKGSSLTLSIDSSSLNLSIYNSLNFASQANFDICSLGGFSTIASGVGLFGGIPFTILPCNGLNTWNSSISGGANPRKLKLLVNNQTVETLELLSNTYWGQPGPVAYNNVSFWSGGVKIYNKDLIGNVDTRDFLQNSWTNSINNTTTINVKNFTTTSPISRLDKIKIALPAVNYVDSIIVTDIGDNLFHRLFVYGATVKTKKHTILWSNGDTTTSISVSPTTTTKYFVTVSNGITTCKDSITVTVSDIGSFNPLQDTVKVCGDSLVLDAGEGYATYNWSNGASTRKITAKNSGKYFVSVTNANGCSASDTSYLSIVKAKIIQADTTICKGSSITLSIDSLFPRVVNQIHQNSFQASSSLWTNLRILNYNSQSVAGNYLNDSLQFKANSLPIHDSIFVSADLYLFDSWDGNCGGAQGPDYWGMHVNGGGLFRTTFSNYPFGSQTCSNVQAYPGSVGSSNAWGTGAELRNLPAIIWNAPISTKYSFSRALNHNSSSLILSFFGNNLQADESWGMDNVVISTVMNRPQVTWSTGATSNSISVSPTTSTKYFVTISDGITTCRDSVMVTVDDLSGFNALQDTVKVCGDSLVLDAGAGFAAYTWSNGATTRRITAKGSGKYFVSVTNANGCIASDTSYVSIIKAKILQSDTAICKGSSISLSIDSSFKGSSICDISQLPNSLRAGLVAFYPFCGDLIDKYSGVAAVNHGSTLVLDRFNNPNSAINFNGSSWLEGVSSNLPIGQAARTVCFWYKESSAATASGNNVLAWGPNILANRFDVSFNHQVAGMSTGAAFSAKTLQLNSGVQISKWNFYSAVVPVMVNPKVADVKLYQNGILLSNVLYSTGINTVLNTIASTPLVIGKNTDLSLPYYLNGQVDDIYIYNRALSATEISSLYTIQPSVNWSTGSTANIITVSPTTKTKYFVTVTDGITTCTDSIVVDISSSELKLTDPAAVCSPAVVDLTAAAVTAGSASGLTFTYWRDANATQALINPDKVSVSGTYFIVGRTATGCTSAPTAVKVTVNPLPVASIVTPTQTTICDNSSLTLTATGGTTYQWLLNGAVIAGATSSTYAASLAGSYEVNVIALGCTSKVAAPVNLSLIKVSVPKFSNSSTCIDVPVSFFNETDTTSSGSVSWLWDFGDGQTSNLFNPVYTYKNSGAFIVKLTVTPKLCSSLPASITKNITVDIPPIGIKYPNVLAVKNKARSLSARFIANGYTYLWMPSTGLNNSAIQKPEFNFSQEQLYRIRLTSAGGCITMDSVKVSVYDSSDIFVPKAFSPNKDGKNDLLQPFLVNITILKFFRIYNRWGQLMFQSSDSKQGWDGMYNYKPQPLETYTWIAEGIDGNGTTIFRKGQTILIR